LAGPADPLCPQDFRDKASEIISNFALAAVNRRLGESCDHEPGSSGRRWRKERTGQPEGRHWNILRFALLDSLRLANWTTRLFKSISMRAVR